MVQPGEPIDTVLRVATPERATFRLELAGPWQRGGAYVADLVARVVVLGVFAVAGATILGAIGFVVPGGDELMQAHAGLVLLAWFALEWAWHALWEGLAGGRTPGKRMFGLRVVRSDGAPIGMHEAFLRNLLRAADLLPPIGPAVLGVPTYFVGIAVCASDPQLRRLGDLAAGTVVVVERHEAMRPIPALHPPITPAELQGLPRRVRLDVDERRALEAFARRAPQLGPARANEVAHAFARALADRLEVPPPQHPARFLALLHYRAHGSGPPPPPRRAA